jgi:hypothetical protein
LSDAKDTTRPSKKKKKINKSLSESEALQWVYDHVPGATPDTAKRFIDATRALKFQGRL